MLIVLFATTLFFHPLLADNLFGCVNCSVGYSPGPGYRDDCLDTMRFLSRILDHHASEEGVERPPGRLPSSFDQNWRPIVRQYVDDDFEDPGEDPGSWRNYRIVDGEVFCLRHGFAVHTDVPARQQLIRRGIDCVQLLEGAATVPPCWFDLESIVESWFSGDITTGRRRRRRP